MVLHLKRETRVLGIDDGPYIRGSDTSLVVLTIYRLDGYVDGIDTAEIGTDGADSAKVIADKINRSRFKEQIRCILSDGACLGGFNVLDLSLLSEETGIPVMTVSDEEPDTESIEDALRAHFPDWERRLSLITKYAPHRMDLRDGACYIRVEGLTVEEGERIVERATVHGRVPEPVRISHLVASALDPPRRSGRR